jgi:hypothetical protein
MLGVVARKRGSSKTRIRDQKTWSRSRHCIDYEQLNSVSETVADAQVPTGVAIRVMSAFSGNGGQAHALPRKTYLATNTPT